MDFLYQQAPPVQTNMPDLPRKKRARKGKISRAARRKIVADQPRQEDGKFAKKSLDLSQLFRSFFTARPPRKLRQIRRKKNTFFSAMFSRKRKRKKPVMERNFLGRIWAIFNGDYARFIRRQARKNSKILRSLS